MSLPGLPTTDLLAALAADEAAAHDPVAARQRRAEAADIVQSFVQQAALSTLDNVLAAAQRPEPGAAGRLHLLAEQITERCTLLEDETGRFLSLCRES